MINPFDSVSPNFQSPDTLLPAEDQNTAASAGCRGIMPVKNDLLFTEALYPGARTGISVIIL